MTGKGTHTQRKKARTETHSNTTSPLTVHKHAFPPVGIAIMQHDPQLNPQHIPQLIMGNCSINTAAATKPAINIIFSPQKIS